MDIHGAVCSFTVCAARNLEKNSGNTLYSHCLQTAPPNVSNEFDRLLSFIFPSLELDERMAFLQGGPILPEIWLYCTLQWLAGGSYSDIYMYAGISKSSFYHVCWHTIFAIYDCDEFQLSFPQSIEECREAAAGFTSIS
jgi:hypothetical protein